MGKRLSTGDVKMSKDIEYADLRSTGLQRNPEPVIIEKDITEVVGIDVEREDRSVGIMGNMFCLVLRTNKGEQLQLWFGDDQMLTLEGEMEKICDTK